MTLETLSLDITTFCLNYCLDSESKTYLFHSFFELLTETLRTSYENLKGEVDIGNSNLAEI